MSAEIVKALRSYGMPPSGHVFHDEQGTALPASQVSKMIGRHMHHCGVAASAHKLRHSFGTEVYRQSRDLRMTQQLLGHSSPGTTAGYVAWAQDEAAGVVARLFT